MKSILAAQLWHRLCIDFGCRLAKLRCERFTRAVERLICAHEGGGMWPGGERSLTKCVQRLSDVDLFERFRLSMIGNVSRLIEDAVYKMFTEFLQLQTAV